MQKITGSIQFFLMFFLILIPAAVYPREIPVRSVNTAYAKDYLAKAAAFCTDENYADALSCVRIGAVYDEHFADFSYLEALCLLNMKEPRGKIIIPLEQSLTQGLQWYIYARSDAELLLAKLYTEMGRFKDVLPLLDSQPFSSADSDFYRASALYGLERFDEARGVVFEALNRWSFDERFPMLFFSRERTQAITKTGKKLADAIIRRLYAWIDENPALAVYACPFESRVEENRRRLQIFRNMHKGSEFTVGFRTQLASILAELRYGVVDEITAITHFFSVQYRGTEPLLRGREGRTICSFDDILELCALTGREDSRRLIAEKLRDFNGIIVQDDNSDSVIEAAVFFEYGRPASALFDSNQDGIAEYHVSCSYGTPLAILYVPNPYTVRYDTYPAVQSVLVHNGQKSYTMRPLALKWNPVEQVDFNLGLEATGGIDYPFFTLKLKQQAAALLEHDLKMAALYCDAVFDTGIAERTHFDTGTILSVETTKEGKLIAVMQYRNGIPVQKKCDYNDDGFFEQLEEYSKQGTLEKISIDSNKNLLCEYYELYRGDGTIVKNWDENEDGIPEIQHTEFPSGEASTVWKERKSGKAVSVWYRNGIPDKLTVGSRSFSIIKEDELPVYWLETRPSFSRRAAEQLQEIFNESPVNMFSYIAEMNGFELFAVQSGGCIFVQLEAVPFRKRIPAGE